MKVHLVYIISVLGSSSEDVSCVWFSPVMEHLFLNCYKLHFILIVIIVIGFV